MDEILAYNNSNSEISLPLPRIHAAPTTLMHSKQGKFSFTNAHLAVVLIVIGADQLTDVLPDLTRRGPRRSGVGSVPHHARMTRTKRSLRKFHYTRIRPRRLLKRLQRGVTSATLTSYLYCFILNHEQLGRDQHHTTPTLIRFKSI
ncbi:hypothetical protein ACJJTC_017008 [Scirpophaga incertulas]